MGNSQKHRHHKKRGGADPEAVPEAVPEAGPTVAGPTVAGPNVAGPTGAAVDPKCCPCPSEPLVEEKKPSIGERSENFVQEKQAAAVAAVTGQFDDAKAAATGKAQDFVASLSKMVGNEPKPVEGGGRRTRRSKRSKKSKRNKRTNRNKRTKKSKRTKRSKSKRSKSKKSKRT